MQDHYNLLYREEEREMLPLCADAGVGVLPWSPLARGRLTRAWDARTERTQTDEFGRSLYVGQDADAVAALHLALTDEEVAELEAPYSPHAVAGF